MKKMKLFIAIITVFAIGFFCITNVNAQSNMVLNKVTYIKSGVGGRVETGFKTNKGYAYCISPTKETPPNGTVLYYKGTINDGGLLYLLKNANSSDSSIVRTRIAVWKYYNNYMVSTYRNNPNTQLVKDVNALVSKANQNKNNLDKAPSVKLTIDNNKMSEVENGKYFKSKAIKVNANNISSASISVTSPAYIVNGDNKKVSTVKDGQKVYIKVEANKVNTKKTYTVKISASKNVLVVEKYAPKNDKYQTLVVLGSEKKSDSYSIKATAAPVVRKCEYANGKYYGKNGNVVDKTTYSIECEKHTCELVGNTYFGKNGNVVDKTTYSIECGKHSCEKVGDTYFGRNGNIVDATQYDIECNKHTCEKIGNTYFGKNGYEVDEITYDKECNKHACEKVGDTYFGKEGTEVDETTFDKECNKHTCELVGDTYFGKNGNIVDETTFDKECNEHTCEIIGDTYFGKTGIEVDKETYEKQCEEQVVEVPDTKVSPLGNLILTIIGGLFIGTAMAMVTHFTKISVK